MSELTDEQIAAAVRHLYANDTAAQMGLADDIATARAVIAADREANRVPEGWQFLPEDLVTHINDWERACVFADENDENANGYWAHQLKTLSRVKAMLVVAPKDACHCNQGQCCHVCDPDIAAPKTQGRELRADESLVKFYVDCAPAQVEGGIRDKLIELGWTPPK